LLKGKTMKLDMKLNIKNIVFDAGGVLLEYTPREYSHKIITDSEAAETVYRELFNGDEWKQIDAGAMTEEEAIVHIKKRIPQYLDNLQFAMDNWTEALKPMAGMPEIISRLREKHYRTFLLSNTSLRFYKFSSNFEMFSYFDGFIISAKEKMLKPDPAIYKLLYSRYKLNPSECLFIDDLQVNIDGAEKTGMHGHLFKSSEELDLYLNSGVFNPLSKQEF
jgi:putative hydrolase of the HAD superfamily